MRISDWSSDVCSSDLWVAAGRFDGFWESDLKIWDVAAGMLLVREAGGFVSDFRGGERAIERSEYIAGSSVVHSKLQKLVAGALRSEEDPSDLQSLLRI